MKTHSFLFIAMLLGSASTAFAQSDFSNCAAAFLDSKRIVDTYAPGGRCEVAISAQGLLSVCQISLGDGEDKQGEKTEFMIAVRDGQTQTYWMYSGDIFREIEIQQVLSRCKPGDALVLMTRDRQWSLPHAEIWVK